MFWTLAPFLSIAFFLAIISGYWRAYKVAGADLRQLHSLPVHHAIMVGACTILPATLFLIAVSLGESWWLNAQINSAFSDHVDALTKPEVELFFRDVAALATGGVVSFPNEIKEQAAALYLTSYESLLLTTSCLIAALCIAGFLWAIRNIAVKVRARHVVERIAIIFLLASSTIAVLTTGGIIFSLISETLAFFQKVAPTDFFFGTHWSPQSAFEGAGAESIEENKNVFGVIPLLVGTLLITVIALFVSGPVGLMAAIYLSEYASRPVRVIAKPALEILAGIPTVVYGFFAVITVAPFFRDAGLTIGLDVASESALAAGVVMGIMIIPFVSSLSDDVINSVPQNLRDGSAGLGATPSETIRKVILPAALPGIVSALILAVSRAIGETMIVVMAAGLSAKLTINPLEAVTTVTVQIVTLLVGDQEFDSAKTLSAFALGLTLFAVTLVLNYGALVIVRRYREQYD